MQHLNPPPARVSTKFRGIWSPQIPSPKPQNFAMPMPKKEKRKEPEHSPPQEHEPEPEPEPEPEEQFQEPEPEPELVVPEPEPEPEKVEISRPASLMPPAPSMPQRAMSMPITRTPPPPEPRKRSEKKITRTGTLEVDQKANEVLYASFYGLYETLSDLLEHPEHLARIDEPEPKAGYTPLLFACDCYDPEVAIIMFQTLIKKGASVKARAKNGFTILHQAALRGNVSICQYICEVMGWPADLPYKSVNSPLMVAAEKGRLEVVKYLVQRGANPWLSGSAGFYPLHKAAQSGSVDTVEYLLSLELPNGQQQQMLNVRSGEDKLTALYVAVDGNKLNVAEFLLANGAEVNVGTRDGATPLFVAAHKGYLEMANLLLAYGADVSLSFNGYTPYAIAKHHNNQAMMALLKEKKGISKSRKGKLGFSGK